jgi:hypothetical protein
MFLLSLQYGRAQFIDKYGLNIGATYSNQLWSFILGPEGNVNQDYKLGYSVFFSIEKQLSHVFSIRPEVGYIQKGFKNIHELYVEGGSVPKPAGVDKKNVVFHDVSLNIGLKITPFTFQWNPYTVFGLRTDYMLYYKDIKYYDPGSRREYGMYKSEIDEYNKANLGGLISIGLEYKNLIYLEFEYNPSLTNSYKTPIVKIKDNCWGIRIGLNIVE